MKAAKYLRFTQNVLPGGRTQIAGSFTLEAVVDRGHGDVVDITHLCQSAEIRVTPGKQSVLVLEIDALKFELVVAADEQAYDDDLWSRLALYSRLAVEASDDERRYYAQVTRALVRQAAGRRQRRPDGAAEDTTR